MIDEAIICWPHRHPGLTLQCDVERLTRLIVVLGAQPHNSTDKVVWSVRGLAASSHFNEEGHDSRRYRRKTSYVDRLEAETFGLEFKRNDSLRKHKMLQRRKSRL